MSTCERCGGEYRPHYLDELPMCKICIMLVQGAVPRIKTEATFQAHSGLGGSQFHPVNRELYLQRAREAGVTTEGRVYEPRLAAYPGDPQAWISNQDEMKSVLEKRGWGCDGDVKVKREETPRPVGPIMAQDIMEDLMEQRLEEKLGPDFVQAKGKVVEQVRDDVLSAHAPPEHIQKA